MKVKHLRLYIFLFLLPTILLFALIYLFPMVTVLVTGFTKWNGLSSISFNGLANYREMFFESSAFRSAFVNTLVWAVLSVVFHVPFGVMLALILARKPFGWKFVRTVSIIPSIVSTSALGILYLFIFNPSMGLLNSAIRLFGNSDFSVNWFYDSSTAFWAVTFMWIFFVGIVILITMAELSAIPKELNESAKIDGASDWKVDWYIHIPLLRNIIGTIMILTVIGVFQQFELIFLTTSGGPGDMTTNISLLVYTEVLNYRWGYANALSTTLMVMGMFIIYLITRLFRMNNSPSM